MDKLSKDNMQINSPVPLGSVVYESGTDCSDVCIFQKDLTEKHREYIRCDMQALCHTRYRDPRAVNVTLDNVGWLIKKYGKVVFASFDEAVEYSKSLTDAHVKGLCTLGFELDENGYSIVKI
ncbi:MAG: hypothetical protein FWE05_05945 [Defluviitaleaceae bacterium]|nr:hypothetical protein [Defluviitaleaceae bacterium]